MNNIDNFNIKEIPPNLEATKINIALEGIKADIPPNVTIGQLGGFKIINSITETNNTKYNKLVNSPTLPYISR